jgi:hypothetical protein
VASAEISQKLAKIRVDIKRQETAKAKIEAEYPKIFRSYRKTMKKWLRLQSKTNVYELGAELDQILTYYRASLAHLSAYFIRHFLGVQQITYSMLFHRINQLQAQVKVTLKERKVTLVDNEKDPEMMKMLRSAIAKISEMKIIGDQERIYKFEIYDKRSH